MSLWTEVRSSLSEWTAAAADRGETMARVGMHQMDRYGIQRRLTRQFAELGGEVHALLKQGEFGSLAERETIQRVLRRIDGLEAELRAKDEEISSLRQKKRSTQTPPESPRPEDSTTGESGAS
jgi:hypothetical protein